MSTRLSEVDGERVSSRSRAAKRESRKLLERERERERERVSRERESLERESRELFEYPF